MAALSPGLRRSITRLVAARRVSFTDTRSGPILISLGSYFSLQVGEPG